MYTRILGTSLLWWMVLSLSPLTPATASNDDRAMREIEATLAQMGGKEHLLSLVRTTVTGITTVNLLEQSVRFEGPYLQNYFDFEETCDFDALTHHVKTRGRGAQFSEWIPTEFTYGFQGGTHRQGRPLLQTSQESLERLRFAPERVILLAARASDLQDAGDVTLNKTPHRKLRFTAGKIPITLFINTYSHLPTAVEITSNQQGFWQIWGDVTSRTEYSNWQRLNGGWRYPFSWTLYRNDMLQSTTTLTNATFEAIASRGEAALVAEFRSLQVASEQQLPPFTPPLQAVTVADGILQFPGMFNAQAILQPDGILVLEAVYNTTFNEALQEELHRRYPKLRIKGVIVTDDAWPHCGGVRPYIASGTPVYAPTENRTILSRIAKAPFSLSPDVQQKARRPLRFIGVSHRLVIGSGPNRCELIRLRGSESERMLAVYFPERKLLYGSDMIQRSPDGKLYSVQLMEELRDMVLRERLTVDTAFAMHSGPVSWQSLVTLLENETR